VHQSRIRIDTDMGLHAKVPLVAIVVKRANPPQRRNKHLCADAGYTGAPALQVIEERGYIPHVKGRGQEAGELKRDQKKEGPTLGCRSGTQLVQSLSQVAGAIREAQS